MIKRIDYKDSLIHAMKTGINLFTGAGFSIKAYDKNKRYLPNGKTLLNELQSLFGPGINDLAKYCSVMERKRKSDLYDYLTNRFKVAYFDVCS